MDEMEITKETDFVAADDLDHARCDWITCFVFSY